MHKLVTVSDTAKDLPTKCLPGLTLLNIGNQIGNSAFNLSPT